MTATHTPQPLPTDELARMIRAECDRATRRLNVLLRERDDILLRQARDSVLQVAAMTGNGAR